MYGDKASEGKCTLLRNRKIQVSHSDEHENSVGFSSTTNPKPKGITIPLPAQANLIPAKGIEPLRCLALRTRGDKFKSSFIPRELSLPTQLSGSWTTAVYIHT